jgi:hypothetical protein
MAMRHSEQSFAARFALAKLAPQHLPSEQDELLALVSMLWQDLKVQIGELGKLKARGKKPRALDLRQLQAYCWALLVLQKDSAAKNAELVQNHLAQLMGQETAMSRKEILKAFREVSRKA